jgi:hypothetical protein
MERGTAVSHLLAYPKFTHVNYLTFRCPPPVGAGAISEEGDVQAAAAKAVGITVPPPALPTACNAITAPTN